MTDEDFIRRTFTLAKQGYGHTWPNPLVGAVIVKDGKILAEGYHHQHGHDHAELDAIKKAATSLEGATIYVNLEPCCHTNKLTPPCAQKIVSEKIKRVVICNLDPNPLVNGKGVELLKQAGIEVEHGLLKEEGEALNEAFFFSQKKQRPFIHLKMATTLDGKVATLSGESQWITGDKARTHVHEMRSHHQGIIIGGQTARQDNPKLNVRLPNYQGKQPWRIVISKSGNLPTHLHLLSDELKEQTLVYSDIEEALKDLFERKLINLILEGGSNLASEFMKRGLVNRVSLYFNPSFLGLGLSALGDFGVTELNKRPKLQNIESKWLGEDLYLTGTLMKE